MDVVVTLTIPTWELQLCADDFEKFSKLGSVTTIFVTFPIVLPSTLIRNGHLQLSDKPQKLLEYPIPQGSEYHYEKNGKEAELSQIIDIEDDTLDRVSKGLLLHPPRLCDEGVGGTYFLRDEKGDIAGVFKPQDEEPGAINHPKEPLDKLKEGLLPGEGAIREVAAFLLDRGGRAKVPPTRVANLVHSSFSFKQQSEPAQAKIGSLQRFVENDGVSWDMGPAKFDLEDVHNIAQLDIRLFNMDRNGANLLIKKNGDRYNLIPIDHTYVLPDRLEGASFEWQFWPQARKPVNEDLKNYIESIDIEADAHSLRTLNIREECIKTMKITTLLLKKAVGAGLNFSQIAGIIAKKIGQEKSELKSLCDRIEDKNDAAYFTALESLLECLMREKVGKV